METPVLIPNTEVKRSCGDDTHMKGKVASRQYKVFNLQQNLLHRFCCGLQDFIAIITACPPGHLVENLVMDLRLFWL